MKMPPTVLACLMLLLVATSCSDDPAGPPPDSGTGAVSGVVRDAQTDNLLAGATVILASSDLAVRGSRTTDPGGAFAFGGVPPGDWLLLVLHGTHVVFAPAGLPVTVEAGRTVDRVVLLLDPELDYLPHGWRVTGTVTDAATGERLAGAWIAVGALAEAGNTVRHPAEGYGIGSLAVSGADGMYSLPVLPVRDDATGDILGLMPVSCGREGYRPRSFVGEGPESYLALGTGRLLPAPAGPDSTLQLDIALEPVPAGGLPAAATGTVTGRTVLGGQPVAGVRIAATLMALDRRDTVPDPDKVVVDGGTAATGTDGTFTLRLEPGLYGLAVGYLPDDGWAGSSRPSDLIVTAGGTTVLGDIELHPALRPIVPADGAVVTAPSTFAWTGLPDADRYNVSVAIDGSRTSFSASTADTFLIWPAELGEMPVGTLVRWGVTAVREFTPDFSWHVGWFEVPATFSVGPVPD
ncbi:MAG: carboxypeptidase-like regulatory domain-containing protein [Candidatus Krumholzibacteriia bacterium]